VEGEERSFTMISEQRAIDLFLRRLYARGRLSIRDAYRVAAREEMRGMSDPDVSCVEAECSLPVARAVAHLLEEPETRRVRPGVTCPGGPVLVPAGELTEEQARVLEVWRTEGEQWACGYDEGPCLVLDTIEWRFGPGWRSLYPEIPCC